MSYGYQDPHYDNHEYEYEDYGNHGNGDYEYELYSDHGEPDQAEPDHCGFENNDYNNVDHEDTPEGFEYGHGEPECDGYEPTGPGYEDNKEQAYWEGGYQGEVEGHEHGGLKDEGDKHNDLVYDKD